MLSATPSLFASTAQHISSTGLLPLLGKAGGLPLVGLELLPMSSVKQTVPLNGSTATLSGWMKPRPTARAVALSIVVGAGKARTTGGAGAGTSVERTLRAKA